jgi:hypothetical protein
LNNPTCRFQAPRTTRRRRLLSILTKKIKRPKSLRRMTQLKHQTKISQRKKNPSLKRNPLI